MILAKCTYNSAVMGHAVPSVVKVRGVTAYNVEAYNTQAINYVIKTQIGNSKKKKSTELQNSENFEYHECNRNFCSFCLKFHYDLSLSECKRKGWLCPFCQGI